MKYCSVSVIPCDWTYAYDDPQQHLESTVLDTTQLIQLILRQVFEITVSTDDSFEADVGNFFAGARTRSFGTHRRQRTTDAIPADRAFTRDSVGSRHSQGFAERLRGLREALGEQIFEKLDRRWETSVSGEFGVCSRHNGLHGRSPREGGRAGGGTRDATCCRLANLSPGTDTYLSLLQHFGWYRCAACRNLLRVAK